MPHGVSAPRRIHDWTTIMDAVTVGTTELFATTVYMDYAQPKVIGGISPDLTIQPAFKAVVDVVITNAGTTDNIVFKIYKVTAEQGKTDVRASIPFVNKTFLTSGTTPYHHQEVIDWDDAPVAFQVSADASGSTDVLVVTIRYRKYRIG